VNTQYATGTSGTWYIYLGGQNTGSSDATIIQIQINGVPYNSYTGVTLSTTLPKSVPSGSSFTLQLNINSGAALNGVTKFASGQTIQVTIITAAGNNYPASIALP